MKTAHKQAKQRIFLSALAGLLINIQLYALSACHQLSVPRQSVVSSSASASAEPQFKHWQLIVELQNTALKAHQISNWLGQIDKQLGAKAISRLQTQSHSYLLLKLDPQKSQEFIQKQKSFQTKPFELSEQSALQFLVEHFNQNPSEYYKQVERNQISEAAAVPAPQASELLNDLSFEITSGLEGWWREETQVEDSWEYSIGTGVTAAYIDQGFIIGHPELQRRLILNGKNNQVSEFASLDGSQIEMPEGDHGTASLLVGFAERHNHIPSVGVAPNARFTPYVAVTVWDAAKALQVAARENPDVIGMNFAFPIYPRWQEHSEYQPYRFLKEVFTEIAQSSQIPIVLPAHNYAEPIRGGPREWIPIAWNQEFDNIIGVGGVAVNGTGANKQLKAWFNRDLMTGINARGSNYGENLIWAPSMFLDIANPRPNAIMPGSMSGTSAACPFVTAAISLILSRLPDLRAREIRDLLIATARPIPAEDLFQKKGMTVPMIQVNQALKTALQQKYGSSERFRYQKMLGRFSVQADGHRRFEALKPDGVTPSTRFEVLNSLNELLDGIPSRFDQDIIVLYGWQGISPLKDHQLEIFACCQSRSEAEISQKPKVPSR